VTKVEALAEAVAAERRFGSLVAVHAVDLSVAAGEVVGLLGANGAGKTTTLRCLAGILPPTSGQALIAGHDLEAERVAARQQLAFVPDEPRLFDNLTVSDHLKVVARIYGVADGAERARELLVQLELADRERSFPSELSRGMKQKLMIAAAFLHRPAALILDEPLTGLDPGAMRRMKRAFAEQAAAGTAVLLSSHLLSVVQELCSRVVIMQRGRKVLEGTLAEIRAALPDLGAEADLEEVFVRATEGPAPASGQS
jgi:ABC-2 type transport system ATP-binding protein